MRNNTMRHLASCWLTTLCFVLIEYQPCKAQIILPEARVNDQERRPGGTSAPLDPGKEGIKRSTPRNLKSWTERDYVG